MDRRCSRGGRKWLGMGWYSVGFQRGATASQRFITASNFAAVAFTAATIAGVGVASARSTIPYSVAISPCTSVSVGGLGAGGVAGLTSGSFWPLSTDVNCSFNAARVALSAISAFDLVIASLLLVNISASR